MGITKETKCDNYSYCSDTTINFANQSNNTSNCLEKDNYFDPFSGKPMPEWTKIARQITNYKIAPLMKEYNNIFENRRKNQCVFNG